MQRFLEFQIVEKIRGEMLRVMKSNQKKNENCFKHQHTVLVLASWIVFLVKEIFEMSFSFLLLTLAFCYLYHDGKSHRRYIVQ